MTEECAGQRPVQRMVRPDRLGDALDAWWAAAYAAGRDGLTHDTKDGAARWALHGILAAHSAALAAGRAEERERCAKLCDELDNPENSADYRMAVQWAATRIRGA